MRRRIIISLGLLLALCLLGDTIAMFSLHRGTNRLTVLAEWNRIQSLRMTLTADSVRVETDLLAHLAGHEHSAEQRAEHMQRFAKSLRKCSQCHHLPQVQARLDGVRETFDAYRAVTNRLYAATDPQERHPLELEAVQAADSLVLQTTEMGDLAATHLAVKSTDVATSIRNVWVALSGTLVVVLVFGGFVAFHLLRRLTRPVEGLLEGIDRVRQGDLTYHFSLETDEEFRRLAAAFNEAYSDLKNAHEGMLQAEKLAAVGKLAAGVAHEVLNPLASISSVAQVMRRRCTSEEQAEQLHLIMEEITRISRIVREMLAFSRPAESEAHGEVEIRALLERAATLIGYDPRARRVGITRCFDPDLRAVRGDAERLLLVCTNIMINALDAVAAERDGDTGGTLAIAARQVGDQVVVDFADDGPGMSEDDIAHAFEPFFTTKDAGAGTGLGLWICYQVIQRHAGTIRIDSRVGEGTKVTLSLPCSQSRS